MGKKRRKRQKAQEKNDEVVFDSESFVDNTNNFVDKTEKFFSKKAIKIAWIALLIIVLIIITSYVRLGTLNLPIAERWAEDAVTQNYRNAIEQQVRAENPNLPSSSIERLTNERYEAFYAENKDLIESQKAQLENDYRSLMQNDDGMTYLLGIDEYYFYSFAKWYERNGFFGTEVVDGEERFMLRDGRFGNPAQFRLHPYLIYLVHEFWSPFNPDFNIEWASYYIQVILIALASIPLFFLAKRFSGTTGGFIATALVLTAIPLVGRTMGGSSDDDAHTILYTFIMLALFVYSLNKKAWVIAVMASLAGLTNAVFMFGWSGWWYGFLLVLGSAGAFLIYEFLRNKFIEKKAFSRDSWIRSATFVVVFFVSAIVFAMLFSPLSLNSVGEQAMSVISSPSNPLELVARLGAGAELRTGAGEYPLWPNVLRTVAELNPASINQIIRGPGALTFFGTGVLFFWLSLIGIVTLFFRYKEDPYYPLFGFILIVWMVGMIFVAQSAVRFILMASIPILLGVGALVGAITGPVANYLSKETKLKKSVFVGALSVVLVLWFLWTPIADARSASEGAIPIFDDAWYDSVYAMKEDAEQSGERGVVSSWWDYGHFFQAYGEQTVTFDGADQGKRIYWMGRTLLTSDVEEAHNILRVMNCGQERPYDLLEEYTGERYRPTRLKLDIAQMSREDARARLEAEGDLPDELIDEVLDLTHCDDLLPMYFVTSGDMVGKAPVWGHFGGWNFTRAYFYYRLQHLSLQEVYELADEHLGMSEEEAQALYTEARLLPSEDAAVNWISSLRRTFVTRQKVGCSEDEGVVTCNYNLVLQQTPTENVVLSRGVFPLDSLEDSQLNIQQVRRGSNMVLGQDVVRPSRVVVERDGVFETHEFEAAGLDLDVVLMDEETRFSSLLTDPSLSMSLFTRLFFMEGRGDDLWMFEKLSDVTSFRGERIIVWKVSP